MFGHGEKHISINYYLYYYVYENEIKYVIIINILKFTRIILYSFNEKKNE